MTEKKQQTGAEVLAEIDAIWEGERQEKERKEKAEREAITPRGLRAWLHGRSPVISWVMVMLGGLITYKSTLGLVLICAGVIRFAYWYGKMDVLHRIIPALNHPVQCGDCGRLFQTEHTGDRIAKDYIEGRLPREPLVW